MKAALTRMKRNISVVLALMMVISALPQTAVNVQASEIDTTVADTVADAIVEDFSIGGGYY